MWWWNPDKMNKNKELGNGEVVLNIKPTLTNCENDDCKADYKYKLW